MLTALGTDAQTCYPYSALLDEMRQVGRFGVGMGMESLPFSIMQDADVPDLDKLTGGKAFVLSDVWVLEPIEDAAGRRRLADTFRHACDQGYLDDFATAGDDEDELKPEKAQANVVITE